MSAPSGTPRAASLRGSAISCTSPPPMAAVQETLHGFVADNAEPDATVFTDDTAAYEGIPNPHKTIQHSVSGYVNGMARTDRTESFWSML